MKKITNIGILSFVIVALFFGATGLALAATNTRSTDSTVPEIVGGTNMQYGIGLNAELEAALKAANIRCATLATSERKAACVKENENAFRAKAEAMYKQVPAQDAKRIEFRGEPVGNVKPGNVRDTSNETRVDAKGDVRAMPAPIGNEGRDFATRFEGVIARLAAYVDRFTALHARIETRAADLSAKGVNVAEAKLALENGQKHLESAKNAIANAKAAFAEEFSSTGTVTAGASVKADGVTKIVSPEKAVVVKNEAELGTKPTPAPSVGGAMGLGMFPKTKEHIKSAGQFLIKAQSQFISANSFLTQAETNLKNSN